MRMCIKYQFIFIKVLIVYLITSTKVDEIKFNILLPKSLQDNMNKERHHYQTPSIKEENVSVNSFINTLVIF